MAVTVRQRDEHVKRVTRKWQEVLGIIPFAALSRHPRY
jgi:hypothetical protein